MVMISDYDSDSDCKDVGSDDNEEGDKKLWWEDNMIIFFFYLLQEMSLIMLVPWQEFEEDKIIRQYKIR